MRQVIVQRQQRDAHVRRPVYWQTGNEKFGQWLTCKQTDSLGKDAVDLLVNAFMEI